MKTLQKQFVLFLADPDIASLEFRTFCGWLRAGGLEKSIGEARKLRLQLRAFAQEASSSLGNPAENSRADVSSRSVVSEIRRLIAGTALSEPRAVQLIAKRLGSAPLPIRPFEKAVRQLVRRHGATGVLEAAKHVRNATAHGPTDGGWDLKE